MCNKLYNQTKEWSPSISLCATRLKTSPPQSNLGRARRSRTTTQQSPHWLQWDAPNSTQNYPFLFDDRHPHLIHRPVPRPTPLTTPNGIRIRSAVLPQYTFRTDRHTDRPTDTTHTHRPTNGINDWSMIFMFL